LKELPIYRSAYRRRVWSCLLWLSRFYKPWVFHRQTLNKAICWRTTNTRYLSNKHQFQRILGETIFHCTTHLALFWLGDSEFIVAGIIIIGSCIGGLDESQKRFVWGQYEFGPWYYALPCPASQMALLSRWPHQPSCHSCRSWWVSFFLKSVRLIDQVTEKLSAQRLPATILNFRTPSYPTPVIAALSNSAKLSSSWAYIVVETTSTLAFLRRFSPFLTGGGSGWRATMYWIPFPSLYLDSLLARSALSRI
jgi:hypothetical protein